MNLGKFDRRIRDILVRGELLTREDADDCFEQAESDKKSFAEIAIASGKVEEKSIIGALAEDVGLCPIDLDKVTIADESLQLLPQDLARYYHVVPISCIGKILTIAVADPFDVVNLDDVKIVTGCELRPVVSTAPAIARAIDNGYNRTENEIAKLFDGLDDGPEVELREEREDDNSLEDVDLSDGAPVVKLVNLMLCEAIKTHASDIHIEPFETKVNVRYRKDGVLHPAMAPPKALQSAVVSRIKIMSGLDIAERRKPQDGKFQLRLEGRRVDFRVSCLPCVHGEKVVLRILDASNLALNLDSLGFEEKALEDFRSSVKAPYGMVLVTGPTGSGKSTTLYSAIREVMSPDKNIVTVEDPVEYELEDVNQVPVKPKAGLTFAGALRSILRQDPDIILVGEIRDTETAEIAVKAALTGHLVLSTLHTNDAPSTITRLVDMGIEEFLVASSTLVVSAQRLTRRLCRECKEQYTPPRDKLISVGFTEAEADNDVVLYRAKGCPRCTDGYRGRFALLETMLMSDSIKRLVLKGASPLDIKDKALEEGMITLRRCGLLNALRGNTSLEEVLNVTNPD